MPPTCWTSSLPWWTSPWSSCPVTATACRRPSGRTGWRGWPRPGRTGPSVTGTPATSSGSPRPPTPSCARRTSSTGWRGCGARATTPPPPRTEHHTPRAAMRLAPEVGDAELGVRLLAAVWWFWYLEGRSLEGMHWARGVLDLPGEVPEAQRPVRLVLEAFAHHGLGAVEAARQAMNTGLELRDRLGDGVSGWVLLLFAPIWLDRKSTRLNSSHTDISRMP